MGFQTLSHANANAIQQALLTQIIGKRSCRAGGEAKEINLPPRELCELSRTWMELEHFKREMRGIPRLDKAKYGDIIKRAKNKAGQQLAAPVDVEEVVEST